MTGELSLLERAQKGDAFAFEQLVTEYEARVYQMALRSTNRAEDAADITQEVFVRVWKRLSDFRGDSALSTWIYRVTMNLCVDYARRRVGQAPTTALHDENGEPLPVADKNIAHQPSETLENAILRQELQHALEQVSAEHRDVVLLRDVSGLSYTEISQVLRIGEGTVKSRLARARATLRKILLERGNITLPSTSKQTGRRLDDD